MKVLLLYASMGAGHKRAADALHEVFKSRSIETEIHDLLEFLPAAMARFYSWAYTFMITDARWLWQQLYERMDKPRSPYAPGESLLQSWQFTRLQDFLRQKQFSHLLSTHFTPSALFTDWKAEGKINGKIFSVVTDYATHRCWKRKGLDGYFVASQEVSAQLAEAGIPSEKIAVSGIPISPSFQVVESREQARAAFNLPSEDPVLLVLCSGLNLQKSLTVLHQLRQLSGPMRFLVSTGSDPVKELNIRAVFQTDSRYGIFGFSTKIAQMMRAADLVATKPGGLIVSEALAMGAPLVLFPPIPGQEQANADYAARQGAAVCLQDESEAGSTLARLLSDPSRVQLMREAASRIGKPKAAETIVDMVMSHLPEGEPPCPP